MSPQGTQYSSPTHSRVRGTPNTAHRETDHYQYNLETKRQSPQATATDTTDTDDHLSGI